MSAGENSNLPLVHLEPLSEEYIDQLIAWRALSETQDHQPISPISREQFLSFVDRRKSVDLKTLTDNEYIFIIIDDQTGSPVGWMTLEIISQRHGLARLGYSIDPERWDCGFATSALHTLIRDLFTNSKIVRVEADCSVDNSPSRRVLEKCGFTLVGIKHKYLLIKDTRVDHYNYELLRDNFIIDQSP